MLNIRTLRVLTCSTERQAVSSKIIFPLRKLRVCVQCRITIKVDFYNNSIKTSHGRLTINYLLTNIKLHTSM